MLRTAARLLALASLLMSGSAQSAAADSADVSTQFAATYTGEVWRNASGGIATGNRYLDNLDLTLDIEATSQLRLFAYGLYNNGRALNDELIGSAQGVSNIESVESFRLYELWLDWRLLRLPLSLRFGLYDLNSEFDAVETAGRFINPSHGTGADLSQAGRFGPSIFPVTSLALRARADMGAWSIQAAVLDGVPGDPDRPKRTTIDIDSEQGALVIAELDYTFDSSARIGLGHWRYTAQFDHLTDVDSAGTPARNNGNAGTYLMVDAPLHWRVAEPSGLRAFARIGVADEKFNPIEYYAGAGLVYAGVFDSSAEDQLGLAVGIATIGKPGRMARAANGDSVTDREYNVELTYRRAIYDWLTLQGDLQYVRHPNMDATLADAWVVGLRFEVLYERSW